MPGAIRVDVEAIPQFEQEHAEQSLIDLLAALPAVATEVDG